MTYSFVGMPEIQSCTKTKESHVALEFQSVITSNKYSQIVYVTILKVHYLGFNQLNTPSLLFAFQLCIRMYSGHQVPVLPITYIHTPLLYNNYYVGVLADK